MEKGIVKFRNGLRNFTRNYRYVSGYVVSSSVNSRTHFSQNRKSKDINMSVSHNSIIKMRDFNENKLFRIDVKSDFQIANGDNITFFYIESNKKNEVIPIMAFNHETGEFGNTGKDIDFLGFNLLKYGFLKRTFTKIVRLFEYSLCTFLNIGIIEGFKFNNIGIEVFAISFFLSFLTIFIIQKFTNLILPSYYGVRKSCEKVGNEFLKFGKKEAEIYSEIETINDLNKKSITTEKAEKQLLEAISIYNKSKN